MLKNKLWYVYMVKCADGTLYTGITPEVSKRIEAHNLGNGAKYTRARRPVNLVYTASYADRSAASKVELQIKKLTRIQKLALVSR